jgi:hypothetical protein
LHDIQNGNRGAYCLTTFLGPDGLHTIPNADFACDILATTLQDSPLDLLRPKFNLSSAKVYSTAIKAEISSKIISLVTPFVLGHLFNQFCTSYSKEPHTALNHIRQKYEDASGNTIFLSVYNYYNQILDASCPFMDQEILLVSICKAFMDGLDTCLTAGFRIHFPNYSTSQECIAISAGGKCGKCDGSDNDGKAGGPKLD